MKKRLCLLIVFFLTAEVFGGDFSVYEANYPGVKDYNVKVDTAKLFIVPRGAYIEMNLELTVSYAFKSWFFKNYTELEFLWDFTLPDQASMSDFWISYEDTLLQARMLDRWTAELLFSEVSSPVRNPALLTQSFPDREGQVQYQLRLYPMMRNEKRKFKIQYLVPARPTNETLRAWLPTTQLTSRLSPGAETLHVVFKGEDRPTLLGADKMNELFNSVDTAWTFDISLKYDQFVELVYPSPIHGQFFFSSFQEDAEYFYQLAVYPPEVEGVHDARNYLVLVDYNRYNTSDLDGELLLMLLKETMQQALTEVDSANILVAFDKIYPGSNHFLPCTEESLDALFTPVLRRSFPAYSYLQILISQAAEFLKGHSKPADVLIFTNTDELEYWGGSREILADAIIAMLPQGTRIHVVDLDNKSNLIYMNGMYETQLASFYGNLCDKTGGNLLFLRYHSIKNILAALFYEKISHFSEVEVQTRFASGYAYGRHLIALHEGYYPLHFPVMEVGRFRGSLPVNVTVLGKVRLDKTEETFSILPEDVVPGNQQLAAAWYGDHIHDLLTKNQSNATVQEITDLSIAYNILSPYTGLLVFKPDENQGYDPTKTPSQGQSADNGKADDGGNDGELPSNSANPDAQPGKWILNIQAYPNPFNQRVTLRITLPENATDAHLSIYDLRGRRVLAIDLGNVSGETLIHWDGKSQSGEELSSGIYVAVIQGKGFKKTVKLNMIK